METKTINIYQKLALIQGELKVPKGQMNKFGGYKYRSCEDILEAVKPVCHANNAVLVLTDAIEQIGDRYYVVANATLIDTETGDSIDSNAYARESLDKKGMDDSQITGTASSYARKYALNGLFNIDDTKDADTDSYHQQTNQPQPQSVEMTKALTELKALVGKHSSEKIKPYLGGKQPNKMTLVEIKGAIEKIKKELG